MSLEFRRRRFLEGLNDYDEHLDEETNERAWDSLKKTSPFEPDVADRRVIEESKRRTMEGLDSITGTASSDEEKARQDVLDSYRHDEPEKTSPDQFFGKSKISPFAKLMAERGRVYAASQGEPQMLDRVAAAEDWIRELDNSAIGISLLSENYYYNFSSDGIAYQGLPAKIQKRVHEKNANFIDTVVKPIVQHENISLEDIQDVRRGVRKLRAYSSSCHDSIFLVAKLQKIPVPTKIAESERFMRRTEGFAWQITHRNYEEYVEDGSFKFNVSAFFSKNDENISTIDILAQTGNIDGLTALYSLGSLMRQNQLLQPRTKQVQDWDDKSHFYREKEFRIDTNREGNELIDGLKSTILCSLSIVDDEIFDRLIEFFDEKLEDETDILELADAADRITDENRKKKLEKMIRQKIERNGHSMRQDAKIDVIQYYYHSLHLQR